MSKNEFSSLEKEMMNFDFSKLEAQVNASQQGMIGAESATDVKNKICNVWSQIEKYVRWTESLPFVGKFLKILFSLLDTICK
ncbi:MAG TPA: hypothetical protein VL098_07780 [Flavipsychrobacter sp.]|nr:hypothetical protein [Flavipsychrobacter sp.]